MKKLISVAVITLFIGLAFAPSINANVRKEGLVEFTTEVCGLNGGKKTVKLTEEEANEVETLFDSIRERLNTSETRDEAEEVFKEAVIELDKYGLLGGLSVRQAQRLITGKYQDSRVRELMKKLYGIVHVDNDSNYLCMVAGCTNGSNFLSFPFLISAIPFVISFIAYIILWANPSNQNEKLATIFYHLISLLSIPTLTSYLFSDFVNPFPISNLIFLGFWGKCNGWLHTYGLFGKKSYEGTLCGKIDEIFGLNFQMHIGVVGFTGLKIFLGFNLNHLSMRHLYLGFAPIVEIRTNQHILS